MFVGDDMKKRFYNNLENSICLDEIVAGAIQRFEQIDFIDLKLFFDDLKKTNNSNVTEDLYLSNILAKYLYISKNGIVKFRSGFNIDTVVNSTEETTTTIREIMRAYTTEEINNYFDNLDIQSFKAKEKKLLTEHKNKMLEEGNILLISDVEEDYEALKKFGFKNVDRFKSLIRAEKFFNIYPHYLDKYQIIIEGNQELRDIWYFDKECKLPDKIRDKRKQFTVTTLNIYDFADRPNYITLLNCENNNIYLNLENNDYFECFDNILNVAFVNESLKKKDNKRYEALIDFYNCNRILPKRKEDLKILYLVRLPMDTDITENIEKLGLNVEVKADNNSSISENVKNHLGDYDIILGTSSFSSNLKRLSCESTEQCKDTGRKLTLLVVYHDRDDSIKDENSSSRSNFLGSEIIFDYTFGGELSNSLEKKNKKEFNAVTNYERDENVHWFYKYQQKYKNLSEVNIQSVVDIYNQALIETGNKPLEGVNLKTIDQFNSEYEEELRKEMERIDKSLIPIRELYETRDIISSYLRNKEKELVANNIEGLNIESVENGVRIVNIEDGKTMGAMTLSFDNRKNNIVLFHVETPIIRDTLVEPDIIYMTEPELVGFYTSKFEGLEETPKRPDSQQLKVIETLQQKIKTIVEPININATKKLLEIVNYEPADKVEEPKKEGFLKRLFKSKK